MEQEDKEKEFERLWEERQKELRGIIAIVGAPYTMKTLLAQRIGLWLKCPMLSVQDFLSEAAMASDEGVLQRAFNNLCKVAHRHIRLGPRRQELIEQQYRFYVFNSIVVIKSRLKSTFELQRLLDLHTGTKPWYRCLLIIECRFTNEYLWKQHFEKVRITHTKYKWEDCSWYRPTSWKEMEEARDEYYHPQTQADQDLLLQQRLMVKGSGTIVRRLVVDPIDILSFSGYYLLNDFTDSIKYLLTISDTELIKISQNPHCYTVDFHELRPYLFEKRIDAKLAAKGRSNDLCPEGGCTFKYWEGLIHHHHNHVCWACDKLVDLGAPAYTCRLCILTLHKSCAERIHFKALCFNLRELELNSYDYYRRMCDEHVPKSCVCRETGFYCESCIFQTHLKYGLTPTIINHNSHSAPHFLSLQVTQKNYRCMACGEHADHEYSYSCKPCGLSYHIKCALLPLELHKHEHGGHEHVMKLLYSHHDTDDDQGEPEESYWCEVCYEDMDPQVWLYSCNDCPFYSAHLHCAGGYNVYMCSNVKNAKFVQQIQSQLEDVMSESNAI